MDVCAIVWVDLAGIQPRGASVEGTVWDAPAITASTWAGGLDATNEAGTLMAGAADVAEAEAAAIR